MDRRRIGERLEMARGRLGVGRAVGRALFRTLRDEIRERSLGGTILRSFRERTLAFANELSYGELLEERAREAPNAPFLQFEEQRFSLGDLDARANAVAEGLRRLGVVPGDAIAILSQNCPEFLDSFFAIQKLGAAAVPINTALVGDGLVHVLDNSRARFLIVHTSKAQAGDEIFDVAVS